MKKVYFLCTGNSCRSQMAEGYAKVLLKGKYEVQSAGIETHGLNPNAVKVMAEDGIDISNQSSKLIDPDYLNAADLVITLCGDARDRCPVLFPHSRRIHWPLPDPAHAEGTDEQKLAVFRQVRNEIKEHISKLD
ncbi:arsenate reductase (thioredoxin) [Limosilactobacillus reuteri]|uniref:arsenate reductase (thioredoxin) n=1 Tax=Limosilactobacillus reuteri TaxID=1598 RepID=UPI000A2E9156|nr:arsenate reductase (thioredoxin) [Limosilactobacillus reuteri]OTA47319.1 arsenate reductase (thioredoxin) [Limosilactobacillus reuteri]OTA50587.1 arsenate reductase (thioredoxin) [Limosilactobacillus reuteri]